MRYTHRIERRDCSRVSLSRRVTKGVRPTSLRRTWRAALAAPRSTGTALLGWLDRALSLVGSQVCRVCCPGLKPLKHTLCVQVTTAGRTPPRCSGYGQIPALSRRPEKSPHPKKEFLAALLNYEVAGGPPRKSGSRFRDSEDKKCMSTRRDQRGPPERQPSNEREKSMVQVER